jgi:hypothetical protein
MPIRLIKGADEPGDLDGVDRHFYENQVGPSSLFDDAHAFRLATARAKDQARHKLIRAVREEEARVKAETFAGVKLDSMFNVSDDFSAEARRNVLQNRTVDGAKGAGDDAIKL